MSDYLPLPSEDWLGALARARRSGTPCALVTILSVEGSAPRPAGTKMYVDREGQIGTVGGGHLELDALAVARAMLTEGAAGPRTKSYPLGPKLGQCCGGSVTILFEPFAAAPWEVWIFGAGHVGKALVHHLAGLPVRSFLVDGRAEQFPPLLPDNCAKRPEPFPEDAVKDVTPGAAALVMTHSHDLDLTLVEKLLKRGDLAYVGLIGSASKRARFEARLRAKGVDPAELVCPIGVDGITDKHPHAIAVSTVAQLLRVRETATARVPV
ncbi:MAG: xanthine dehydrogenase accessory protein XdhC [Tagaea sp.]